MNKPVKAVILDWNGTVLDDVALCVDLLNELLTECNHPAVDRSRYLEIFDFPIKEYYKRAGFDFSKESYEELADRYMPRYLSRYEAESVVYPDVQSFLTRCREEGIITAVLSVTRHDYLVDQVARLGLRDSFDYVVGQGDHYGGGKEVLADELIMRMGVSVDEVLFVGDTTHDHEVASSVGAGCILISHGHQSRRRLQEITAQVVDSFDEIELD